MTIKTPLHADHQLDQLAGQFAHWRQTRTHPYERIPHELWDQAVALAAALPPSRVAKQLRLRLADLKKQMAARHAATAAMSPLPLGFVEVPPAPAWPPPPATTQIELHRADGTRLCIHAPESTSAAGRVGAGLFGGPLMLQLTPQSRIFVATATGRFPQRHRWPRGRVPAGPGRQPPGGRRLRLPQPRGHGAQTLAL